MLILGIESSCDETAVSVCRMSDTQREVLSDCIRSQVEIHKLYGGVVPEIASRAHAEAICGLCTQALTQAGAELSDVDAIGVTATPGLVGALLVGVNFAKGLAYAAGKPLVAVNHIRGHIAAAYLAYPELKPPFFALVASGAHTSLVRVRDYTDHETVGRTRDDAVGEAFDKVARVMGIPYPGGAAMDALAKEGDPAAIRFPSAAIAGDNLDFSFSGLKTSVINYLNTCTQKGINPPQADVAACFTAAVCGGVTKKLALAYERYGFDRLVLAGGVAANSHLRAALTEFCDKRNIGFYLPPLHLCGDNGAMIAAQAYYEYCAGNLAGYDLNARATGK